jgi:Zn-dependent protease
MTDPRDGWTPLTAQLGDDTYSGFWRIVGREVEVAAPAGARRQRLADWDHPANLAERLLIDLHTSPATPSTPPQPTPSSADPAPARPAARPAPPPNNLVGLALLGAFLLFAAGLILAPTDRTPLTFGFVLTGWLLAVMGHEFSHALIAYLGGDRTVKAKGYLSFDPRRYGDLQTSLVLPVLALALGGIGFPGGAVYIRNDLIRSPAWRAAAALAGPAATFLILAVLAVVLNLWARVGFPDLLYEALAMLAFLQATALILNLLPLPGLDGFNAVRPFLPARWTRGLRRIEGVTMLLLLAALLLAPGVSGALFGAAFDLAAAMGVPRDSVIAGWDAFHFWRR